MPKSPQPRSLTRHEIRGHLVRITLLAGLCALVYWAGWRSRWARADTRVVVTTDAPTLATGGGSVTPVAPSSPRDAAAPAEATQPLADRRPDGTPQADGSAAAIDGSNDGAARKAAVGDDGDAQPAAHTRRHRRMRRAVATELD